LTYAPSNDSTFRNSLNNDDRAPSTPKTENISSTSFDIVVAWFTCGSVITSARFVPAVSRIHSSRFFHPSSVHRCIVFFDRYTFWMPGTPRRWTPSNNCFWMFRSNSLSSSPWFTSPSFSPKRSSSWMRMRRRSTRPPKLLSSVLTTSTL